MAKSILDEEVLEFYFKVDELKRILKLNNEGLAELLGCSSRLVRKMLANPLSVKGEYILKVSSFINAEPLDDTVEAFLIKADRLKRFKQLDNKGLAELLGCSRGTVWYMYNNPLSTRGEYILKVQGFLAYEERRRYA